MDTTLMAGKPWQPNFKPLFSKGGRQAPFTPIGSVEKRRE